MALWHSNLMRFFQYNSLLLLTDFDLLKLSFNIILPFLSRNLVILFHLLRNSIFNVGTLIIFFFETDKYLDFMSMIIHICQCDILLEWLLFYSQMSCQGRDRGNCWLKFFKSQIIVVVFILRSKFNWNLKNYTLACKDNHCVPIKIQSIACYFFFCLLNTLKPCKVYTDFNVWVHINTSSPFRWAKKTKAVISASQDGSSIIATTFI